ncbi:hypothetical protein REPUB_Repub15cG0136100 [Reevesia pubescens]
MMKETEDKSSVEYQRLTWDALRKSINGLVNKVNATNIKNIIPELFAENLIRGRGLFCRSCMKSQMASPGFTDVFAALVAVVNTKFPEVGDLLLRRILLQLKRAYKRNDKPQLLAAVKFVAHLVNQQVAYEIIALELLTVLLENPTDDSVEVAVGFVTKCGSLLQDLSPKGLHGIFERFRGILHEGEIDKRVQFLIEGLFAIRKAKFQGYPAVLPELDLVEQEDQLTHEASLQDEIDPEITLDIFKQDPHFLVNEKRYEESKKTILGDESEDEDGSDAGSDDEEDDESDEEDEEQMKIKDETETNLVNLRRTIYLTIMSSVDFEEAGHKLLKIKLEPGQEMELCIMLLECCSQERTYLRYYGLLGQRFCMINKVHQENFEKCFVQQYSMIHRLETNKLRNVAKFFAHLLGTDALPWPVLSYIRLTEEDTTSSSRIFIKILFQELSEHLGIRRLNERLSDPTMQDSFESIFPRDNPKNMRFSINFFTSIGLGGITENLREYLKNMPRLIMQQQKPASESESESEPGDESGSSSSSDSESASSESESVAAKSAGKVTHELSTSLIKATSMFSGTQQKCATCGKIAYPLEKVLAMAKAVEEGDGLTENSTDPFNSLIVSAGSLYCRLCINPCNSFRRRSHRSGERENRSDRRDNDNQPSRRNKDVNRLKEKEEGEIKHNQSALQPTNLNGDNTANLGRSGGVYIPPFKLARMMEETEDKSSVEYQRLTWDALRKSINGLVNKVNATNIKNIIPELFAENLIRGRGLFCRSCMKSQMASPGFTDVFAALVAVVNTKFPEVGDLLLRRILLQLKRAYKRNDKPQLLAAVKFVAHLVNQQVAYEIIALELLTVLLENPTDDSVEVAVGFVTECGSLLQDLSPKGLHGIFERFRGILHEGEIDKRVQFLIEGLFAIRKAKFQGYPAVRPELDLFEQEDQLTHEVSLQDEIDPEITLDIFKQDPHFLENEKRYEELKKTILGDESEDEDGSDAGSGDEEDDESDEEDEEQMKIQDETESNLVNLRRTIYLTIMSSVDFEEAGHKLLKIKLEPGQEMELCIMLLECCSQERTYLRYYGLLGLRFCMINKVHQENFEKCFVQQYSMIHRLETNKLRNVAKFFAHLLGTDALPWHVLSYIHLTEEDTTSSSRIFIKILFQELSEHLGIRRLNERLSDPTMQDSFESIFPRDNPKNTRFSINFFTSIGLGGITENLR